MRVDEEQGKEREIDNFDKFIETICFHLKRKLSSPPS